MHIFGGGGPLAGPLGVRRNKYLSGVGDHSSESTCTVLCTHLKEILAILEYPYKALTNSLLLISIPFSLIFDVFNIEYLVSAVKLLFVATLV